MRFHIATALVLLALPAAVPAQQPDSTAVLPSIELPAELERVLRDYERAWAAGDAQALARLFTDDGFVSGRAGWRRGRAGILNQYASSGGQLRLRAHAYFTSGDAGWIVGAYGYGDAPEGGDVGKFLLALRRGEDGRWLIAADLDSANRRPGS